MRGYLQEVEGVRIALVDEKWSLMGAVDLVEVELREAEAEAEAEED
jgi:hypothetical protein